MWNELAKYRNHFLQKDVVPWLIPVSINRHQEKEFERFVGPRGICRPPFDSCKHSTYFEDRTQLAYGWFALPKLMREMDSDSRLTHWRAIKSLSEFLLNPLHCERAIVEKEIVRKTHNAFMRFRRKHYKEEYNEIEVFLDIYIILSRTLNGAQKIAKCNCLMNEFYAILTEPDKTKHDKTAEILRNLSGNPDVIGTLIQRPENFELCANIFLADECRPKYPPHLWFHLTHYIGWSPERAIELGLFEYLYKRIKNRIIGYMEMNMKAFGLILRCEEGQKRFDAVDGVKLLYDIFDEAVNEKHPELKLVKDKKCKKKKKDAEILEEEEEEEDDHHDDDDSLRLSNQTTTITPVRNLIVKSPLISYEERKLRYPSDFGLGVKQEETHTKRCIYLAGQYRHHMDTFIDYEYPNYEFTVLALQNGLHSKHALWRCREFTLLANHIGELLSGTINPQLQLYCLRTLREMAVMPVIKRYIITTGILRKMSSLISLNVECECTRDEIVEWLRRDINDSSD